MRRYTRPAMPTYEYVCKQCGHLFEIVQSMRDEPLTECPECGGELRKVFAPPAISFKGSGFYATDSRKKATKPAGPEGRREERRRRENDKKDDGGRRTGDEEGVEGRIDGELRRLRARSRRRRRRRAPARARRRYGGERGVTTADIGVFGGSGFYSFLERYRDRRGRDALRLARARPSRSVRSAAVGGVPAPARLEPRVPAAPHPLPGERVGDEGARRRPGARAERVRLAAGRT